MERSENSGNTIPFQAHQISNALLIRLLEVRFLLRPPTPQYLANLAQKLALVRDDTQGKEACWPIMGVRGPDGVIRLHSGNRTVPSDQAALEVSIGRLLTFRETVVHDKWCFPWCTNPDHLSVGPAPRHLSSVPA